MKIWFLLLCFLALNACGDLSQGSFPEKASKLQGVYDEKFSLRLAEVAPGSTHYRFESCWSLESTAAKKCVPAFLGPEREDVTFVLEDLSQMVQGSERTLKQASVLLDWQAYKAALSTRQGQVGGAAVVLSVGGAVTSLAYSRKEKNIKEAMLYLDPDRAARKVIEKHDLSHYANLSLEELKAAYEYHQGRVVEARSLGIDIPPHSLLTEEQIRAIKKSSSTGIISDGFVDFFEAESDHLLTSKNMSAPYALRHPFSFAESASEAAHFKSVVAKFLDRGHHLDDLVNPQYKEIFKKFLQAEFVASAEEFSGDILGAFKEQPKTMFHRAQQFVASRGVSPGLSRVVERLDVLKQATKGLAAEIAKDNLRHPHRVTRLQKQLKNSKAIKGVGFWVTLGSVVVGGALVLKNHILKNAAFRASPSDGPSEVESQMENLKHFDVVLDHSDALLDDSSERVDSVEDMLVGLGYYLRTVAWVAPGTSVGMYCLPDLESTPDSQTCKSLLP